MAVNMVCNSFHRSTQSSDRVSGSAHIQEPLKNPAPAVRTLRSRRQQAQPRSVTRGEAVAPRNESCQTSGALRWAQQLTDTALIEISKAPASGAAGTGTAGICLQRLRKRPRTTASATGGAAAFNQGEGNGKCIRKKRDAGSNQCTNYEISG